MWVVVVCVIDVLVSVVSVLVVVTDMVVIVVGVELVSEAVVCDMVVLLEVGTYIA